ncbi:putative uncharacterized protein DDB_G0289963 [Gigantopelta aegis]|uniref:putative uncharacterized protein DDB_G0289963 n=1 Tax=Gigantopelta aegis TaxID=1735272 RepID=UPI001B88C769|nr:putative uncharacterized protein DDB_G0289963 [Gigantopelta aegis]
MTKYFFRKRRNDSKSVDNVTPKRNNNLYSDTEISTNISEQPNKSNNDYTEIDLDDLQPEVTNGIVLNHRDSLDSSTCSNVYWTVDPHDLDENENTNNDNVREKSKRSNGAVNICYSKDDVIQSPNRDQTKKKVQVVVIANDLPASKPDNTPQKSNRSPIKPRKFQAAFSNKEAENEGSGDISSELGEHPVSQTNADDIETKVNDKPGTTPESSSICVPEEEMKDNFLYSMDGTEFQDSQKCVPEEEMKVNFLHDMDDDDTQFQDSLKCVPEEEMKDNFLYSMDDTEV